MENSSKDQQNGAADGQPAAAPLTSGATWWSIAAAILLLIPISFAAGLLFVLPDDQEMKQHLYRFIARLFILILLAVTLQKFRRRWR